MYKLIIRLRMALKERVNPFKLDYIGIGDYKEMLGYNLEYFNVMDPAHPKYKSTVAVKAY